MLAGIGPAAVGGLADVLAESLHILMFALTNTREKREKTRTTDIAIHFEFAYGGIDDVIRRSLDTPRKPNTANAAEYGRMQPNTAECGE